MQLISHSNGVFTLPDTKIDTETNKKWVVWKCVVFTVHTDDNRFPWVLCTSRSRCGSLSVPLKCNLCTCIRTKSLSLTNSMCGDIDADVSMRKYILSSMTVPNISRLPCCNQSILKDITHNIFSTMMNQDSLVAKVDHTILQREFLISWKLILLLLCM